MSIASSLESGRQSLGHGLTRQSTAYTVKEIYGDMDENDIYIRRTATRTTILTALSNRVHIARLEADKNSDDSDDTKSELDSPRIESFYENIPDISVPAKDFGGEFSSLDPELVTWEGEDDPDYPRNWSNSQRLFQLTIVSFYSLISPMSSSMLSPAMNEIGEDLNISSDFLKSFSVSIMVLAWALGPLLIAPISESDRFGRRPVLNLSIWIIFAFNLACAFAKNTTQLCVFRFLGGLGGCASLNVGAGTLADLFSDNERQLAMAAYSICPTLGPVLSPIISSFIISHKSWHWVFYVLAIFNGAVGLFGTIFFRETYSPKLLKMKADRLRKETGNNHLHTIFEIADGETAWGNFVVTISRPVKLLFTHPMVIGLGSFMAFVYGFMYLMIVTFPQVFRGTYGFSIEISGLMYIPLGIGYLIGTVFWSIVIDKVYLRLTERNGGIAKPEYRLPCLCFSGIGIPVGLIWYGWSAQKKLHWIMPSIGMAIFSFSFIAVFQTIQNYLIDMNNRFAASSVAAAAVFRSFFGFAFPLFAHQLYDKLDYGWGNTLCALIGLALGLPFPIFCLKYGEKLRKWANRRMNKEQATRDVKNLERLKKLQDLD
ncbi:multidrug resistance protein 4 [Scheffersomyces xylosifermentans]|uniref:multidrug resistance protein 4 n=1 Tax=Scheffersomyces xylosifermentans TaxID=1304137 RepID=UPI00315DAA64